MTRPSLNLRLAPVLLLAGAALVAGCGDSDEIPPGAVAKVGDTVITQEKFDKWMTTAVKGQAGGAKAVVPDPPDFTKCVAGKKDLPTPEGQPEPSAADLKKQCKTEFDELKRSVMQFLIQSEWVLQEAEEQGVTVKDAEVAKSFEDQKKQAFPKEADYQKFLASSGMSEKDILFRVRLQFLRDELTKKISEKATKVSDEQISAYYDKNKKQFAQPERRDLLLVVTKTRPKAEEAKKALEGGQPWKKVATKFSIDEATKSQGGKFPGVAEGQQEPQLDKLTFAADKGELVGPVKTQFGWYVVEVDKILPASQQSLEESKDTIKNLLRSEGQQKALDRFVKDFRQEYKAVTECDTEYRVAECKNAPKEESDTGPASGGNPGGQQQPAQPAPTPTPENPQP